MKKNLFLGLLMTLACVAFKKEGGHNKITGIYEPPSSPRAVYNYNPDWKFVFGDSTGAEKPEFDDSKWSRISLPHTWNDTDTYRAFISHSED